MAKSPLEREIEKQRKATEKQIKEQKKIAETEARRQKASAIVNGQPIIGGIKIIDKTAEEVLISLLKLEVKANNQVNYDSDIFPSYIGFGIGLELEKLTQYGMITSVISWMDGGMLNLTPQAFTYFEDKELAIKMDKEKSNANSLQIGNIYANGGSVIFGDVKNSSISIDNSINQIVREIENKGGEDKEALLELLAEVKELTENIESSRSIPKQKTLFQKISNHAAKHSWFYAEIIGLLGTTAIKLISG